MGFVVEKVRAVLTARGEVVSVVALEMSLGGLRFSVRREGVTDAEEGLAVNLPGDEL